MSYFLLNVWRALLYSDYTPDNVKVQTQGEKIMTSKKTRTSASDTDREHHVA